MTRSLLKWAKLTKLATKTSSPTAKTATLKTCWSRRVRLASSTAPARIAEAASLRYLDGFR